VFSHNLKDVQELYLANNFSCLILLMHIHVDLIWERTLLAYMTLLWLSAGIALDFDLNEISRQTRFNWLTGADLHP